MNIACAQIKKTTILGLMLLLTSNTVASAILPESIIPDKEILELLESGPDWIPKPYKTPIQQGSLLNKENLDKVQPGLNLSLIHI